MSASDLTCIIWVARVQVKTWDREHCCEGPEAYKTVCVEAPASWPGTAAVLASEFGKVLSVEPDRRRFPRRT